MISNAIYGFSGKSLSEAELEFFKLSNPCGYIIFARNIENPEQLKELTASLRAINNNPELLILIDQEGGRVRRLKPPHFRDAKATGDFAKLAAIDINAAQNAVELNHYLIGRELIDLGINMDCAPVADLKFDWAHDIIGDRSFGSDPKIVSLLCRSAILGLNSAGVHEVIKHMPGHGRALADSHLSLPIVETELEELARTDFAAFQHLSDAHFAMTAHVVFTSIDSEHCITHSSTGIDYIRNEIGFTGIIMSDDLSMEALEGSIESRAKAALQAGCDILLHCNGKMDEMMQVASVASEFHYRDSIREWSKGMPQSQYKDTTTEELEVILASYFDNSI